MFDTKIVLILREDLPSWQALNVAAFLMSGVTAGAPEIIGEPYLDRDGRRFLPISGQPVIVLEADGETIRKAAARMKEQNVDGAAYIEEMFSTGHDAANRAVFSEFGPDNASFVGLGFRAPKKIADKISKGARMHR
ncbi:DUF2000 family protein [Rhizobium sp. FKL33]|uniref:DUF2000 family protein n=1 Tax=Rhizobium sp. FKL33 TaxID=2562307 RepID=UPI0010C0643E|nr:DUF2000 family protein [Rhizobium sp. FKL33]